VWYSLCLHSGHISEIPQPIARDPVHYVIFDI